MTEKIKQQILTIRDTGKTNMFDTNSVQRLAYDLEFFDLVLFIEDHKDKYIHFIMTGE
jgi:hypothetical protein